MNDAQRLEYMATADRVTVGITWQLDEAKKSIKRFYVAKVRGIVVSENDVYMFNTPEEARATGKRLLECWRKTYYTQENTPNQRDALDSFSAIE